MLEREIGSLEAQMKIALEHLKDLGDKADAIVIQTTKTNGKVIQTQADIISLGISLEKHDEEISILMRWRWLLLGAGAVISILFTSLQFAAPYISKAVSSKQDIERIVYDLLSSENISLDSTQ
jgi:hypothetical protein